jgi:hypothetical protein
MLLLIFLSLGFLTAKFLEIEIHLLWVYIVNRMFKEHGYIYNKEKLKDFWAKVKALYSNKFLNGCIHPLNRRFLNS